jgi:hypothetical protein
MEVIHDQARSIAGLAAFATLAASATYAQKQTPQTA